jgi:ABC-2 type transport system permease protein
MHPIQSLFKREFFGYFRSPIAYVFLTVFLVAAMALVWFVGGFFAGDDASLIRLFVFMPWIFLFLVPAVGMRLWAEEKRSGTWELLLTMPLTLPEAVIGKFLAGWAFVSLAVALTFTLPITVAFLGDPDWGPILSGYFGTLLLAGAYLSVCSLTSALTRNQVVSFVISVVVCLVLVLTGWSIFNELLLSIGLPIALVDALSNFSFTAHLEGMVKGVISFRDVLFYVSVMAFCLTLNVLALER